MAHSKGDWWPEKKKLEVVTTYLVLGKASLVAASTGVPEGTVRRWMIEPWWKEMVDQVRQDSDQELDSKLEQRLSKVLDLVQDRLDNGDFMFDPKSGEFIRRPVALKDGWKVGREMFDVRMILRKQKPEQVSQEGVADILKGLATEFAQMARNKVKEKVNGQVESTQNPAKTEVLVDGEKLQERVPELSGEARPDQETGQAEQSSASPDESRSGT